MSARLDTLITAEGKVYGPEQNPLAIARYDSMSHAWKLEWTNDVLGWGTKRFQSLETCDWTALAYVAEQTACGY